jgi:hypothetical protein
MVHGVFALMNICQIDVLSALRYSASHVSRWFMGVCTHEHLPDLVLFALRATAPVMSADGSWVFAYEHLPRLAVLCSRLPPFMSADGSWVFALAVNI